MGKREIANIQKDFLRFHKYLFVLICVYVLERFSHNMNTVTLRPVFIASLWFLADMFFTSNNFFESYRLAVVFRYIQLFAMTIMLSLAENFFSGIVITLCLLLFIVEYFSLFDFLDNFDRYSSYVSFVMAAVIGLIVHMVCTVNGALDTFSMIFTMGLFVIIVLYVGNLFYKCINKYHEQILSQNRLISGVNKVNDELRDNQEKVKKANEELGMQKIQLEAAYKKINAVNSEITIQNEIVKYISSSLEVEKIMSLITEAILEGMGLNICTMILYPNEEEKKKLSYNIKSSLGDEFISSFGRSIEKGELDDYLYLSSTYVDNTVNTSAYPFLKRENVRSMLIAPLIWNDKQIGALFAGSRRIDFFTENKSFFEAIVGQFLIALDNANLYSKMEYLATRDGLTGIYNRGHLTKLFNEYLNEAIMNKTSLTAALFDIDKFKNVNDTYGHLFGDEVIKTIASLADTVAEENNGIVGRYGGEEFVIVFPNKGLLEVLPLIEKMHKQVKSKELFHNGQSVFVSVSVGVTSYPETCKNPGELLNRADWSMYYSKQNGRDRITIDSDEIRDSVLIK